MSTRAQQYVADVLQREQLSPHLVRLTLGGPGLAGFVSTGIPDEWVGLVVPGQFQSRYYTVRSWDGTELVLDIVVHDVGLVTEWASGDCVGDQVTVTEPKGSFAMPEDAAWLLLVGDLTALPAMARIAETHAAAVPTRIWAEAPDLEELSSYLSDGADVTWLSPPVEEAVGPPVEGARPAVEDPGGRGAVPTRRSRRSLWRPSRDPVRRPAGLPRWSRGSTGPRVTATSGWPGSRRRCEPSGST